METASEVLYRLNPVSFRYHKEYDATQTVAFGLIAEEVAQVAPDLVGRNPNGEPESVRYEQINAMLLNEFLKEHRKVEKLEATVADLAEQLQKISAQVQMKNSNARVADK
jgi:Lhr-like helicase